MVAPPVAGGRDQKNEETPPPFCLTQYKLEHIFQKIFERKAFYFCQLCEICPRYLFKKDFLCWTRP